MASLRSGEGITADAIAPAGDYPVYGGNGLRGYTSAYTHEGDRVLIGRQGALCGNVNYAAGRFWASEHAVVAEFRETGDVRWLGELLRAMNLGQYSQSAAQPGLAVDVIANREIPVPPPDEQRAIADLLDGETARLDALVAAKERLLGLLAEKRRALITRAVTRGLDEGAAMRNSGVPWLGEIPAHWSAVPFRWYFRLASGDFISSEQTAEHADGERQVPVVGGNGIAGYTSGSNALGPVIVIGRVGALCGNVHLVSENAWVTDNALLLRDVRDFDLEFLSQLLAAMNLNSLANKSAQPLITGSLILELRGPLPSVSEQRAIVAHIAEGTRKLDALRAATERTLVLLRERRAALITAAVTGQLAPAAA